MLSRYIAGFSLLKNARQGFWPLQVVGMLDTMAYWSMVGIIVITLTDDFGYSDVDSGRLYTLSAISLMVSIFFAGTFIDAIGIRLSLMLGFLGSILTRGALFLVAILSINDGALLIVMLSLIIMGPCVAVLQTIYSLGAKVYTGTENRSAGYNMVYLVLNVGAAGAGFMIDIFFLKLGLPRFYILGAGTALAVVCLLTTMLFIPKINAKDNEATKSNKKNIVTLLMRAFSQAAFWRFMTFMVLLTPIRASLIYFVLIAPKYWIRMIGPDAQIGFYEALNPILVILGTLMIIPYVSKFNVYKSIAVGALFSAVGLFFLAIPVSDFSNISSHTQTMTICFILALTIGELTWAPRLWDYTTAIAPKGLEATYLGIAGLPLGLSKTGIAYASGYMLQKWCPPDVSETLSTGSLGYWESPPAMWFILATIATVAAISVLLLRPWITKDTQFCHGD